MNREQTTKATDEAVDEVKQERIENNFGKSSDRPGAPGEATKKSNRRGQPAAPGEKIEGDEEDGE